MEYTGLYGCHLIRKISQKKKKIQAGWSETFCQAIVGANNPYNWINAMQHTDGLQAKDTKFDHVNYPFDGDMAKPPHSTHHSNEKELLVLFLSLVHFWLIVISMQKQAILLTVR